MSDADAQRDEAVAAWYRSLPAKRIGAGVVFVNEVGHPLLVQPAYKPEWEIPGGLVEYDESPRAAASREVAEELGIDRPVGRLLVVDWVRPHPPRTEGLNFLFDGGALTAADAATIRLRPGELLAFEFVPADRLAEYLWEPMARRVKGALDALGAGTTLDLENREVPR